MRGYERLPRLAQLDVLGRRVFVRADLDGPRSPQGAVLDDTPLRRMLPALRYLVEQHAKVVLATTLSTTGREESRLATQGMAERLGVLLGAPVTPLGWNFQQEVRTLSEGQIALAPNLAALPEDAANNPVWAMQIAASVDAYVLDGLRAAHDGGASVVEVPKHLLMKAVGPLIGEALDMHHDAIGAPAPEPYSLILGGSSVRRLMPLVRAALPSCHAILLGGAVANTFLVSRGWQPGASSFASDELDLARQLFEAATAHRVNVYYPVDGLVRTGPPGPGASFARRAIDGAFPPSDAVADIGLETINTYREVIARSATVLWVGLMGDCSIPETQVGSIRVGQTAAAVPRALVVGDDTVQAAVFFRLDSRLRVAAGGDLMLELLSDALFPGLEAVRHRRDGEP